MRLLRASVPSFSTTTKTVNILLDPIFLEDLAETERRRQTVWMCPEKMQRKVV